jgi:hypothetical protein
LAEHSLPVPNEAHSLIEFRQRDLPGFATVNSALTGFESKALFPWHLSVMIRCEQLVEHRLPSPEEQNVLYGFEDRLNASLKVNANALRLERHDPDLKACVYGAVTGQSVGGCEARKSN